NPGAWQRSTARIKLSRRHCTLTLTSLLVDSTRSLDDHGRKRSNMQGTIKKIVSDRGFGFIATDSGSELFFHASSVEGEAFDALREGQQVDFTSEQDPRGRGERAVHVRTI